MSALLGDPELAPRKVSLLAPPSTLSLALYWAGGDHSVAHKRTFGLTEWAVASWLTSDEKLLVGSIRARREDIPMWPFTLSSANKAWPWLPMALQALEAPMQWMNWVGLGGVHRAGARRSGKGRT